MAKPHDPWAEHFKKALLVRVKEPVGPGWLTRVQFMARTGLGESGASDYLTRSVRDGSMDRFRGSQDKKGAGCPQTWYRPKQ